MIPGHQDRRVLGTFCCRPAGQYDGVLRDYYVRER